MAKWIPPTATVIDVALHADVIRVTLRISKPVSHPLAPAQCTADANSPKPGFELHALVEVLSADTYVFETYDWAGDPPPAEGLTVFYQQWWTPEQHDVASDLTLTWEVATYERTGDHEHCALTWETIRPGDACYRALGPSGKSIWLTLAAYEEYIRGDKLRLRRQTTDPAPYAVSASNTSASASSSTSSS